VIELAAIVPFFSVVPRMTTVLPGKTSFTLPDTVFVTCDAADVVTFTVLPLVSVM
jgi:hypothetical protein